MGIYIKNMDMPEGCFECPLSQYQFDGEETVLACFALCEKVSDDGEIAENCPLVKIPPHNDLIDRDRLLKRFCGHCEDYGNCKEKCFDLRLIENTPTVVPAEEGET